MSAEEKKYEFTGETLEYAGTTLHRIRAKVDYPDHIGIEAGRVGGWVESYDNLSGDAWVADEAKVYGHARVAGEALIDDDAEVRDEARVWADACVCGNATVGGRALVHGWAVIRGTSLVIEAANVYGDVQVADEAVITGNAYLAGDVRVNGEAVVRGDAFLDRGFIGGRAVVEGRAYVTVPVTIGGCAIIKSSDDFLYFGGFVEPCTVFRTRGAEWKVQHSRYPEFNLGITDEDLLALCEREVEFWGFGDSDSRFKELKKLIKVTKSLLEVE